MTAGPLEMRHNKRDRARRLPLPGQKPAPVLSEVETI
jgi:hypothetical protein